MATPSTTAETAAIAAATTTSPVNPDLQALLLTDVPAGYRPADEGVGDAGPVDLEKATREDGDPDARDTLTAAGFDAGYQRVWVNDQEDEIVVYLYRFQNDAGANRYSARLSEGNTEEDGFTEFPVEGIPGAKAFTGELETGSSAIVFFSKGVYSVQVVVNGREPAGQQGLVSRLAAAQYLRLP
jgi:hypothetical protein